MTQERPYVEVCYYGDRGDPLPPNNYRPELVTGELRLLLDWREPEFSQSNNNGCMPKRRANDLARRIADRLGIEAKLVK